MARLGDLCNILNGYAFKSEQYVNDGIRIIRIANVQKGYVEDSSPVFYPEDNIEAKKYSLIAGDLLMSLTGNVGRVAIITDNFLPAALNQRVACLRIKDKALIEKSFLFNLLNTDYFEQQCINASKGVAQKNMSTEWLKEYSIPLFSIERQREISAVLNKVGELISLRKQQLAKLDELVKSRFVEMFGDPVANPMGWPCEKLGQLVAVEPQNGLYKPQSDYVQDGSGTPILRIDAFYNGKVIDFRKLKRLLCTETEKQRYLLHENDIVINRVNSIEYLGKCAHICGMAEDTVFESNMMRFHMDEAMIDAGYITHLLCTKYVYNQILYKAKKAVNQASINQDDVRSFEVLVPPISLQKQFVTFVEQTDKQKLTIQQSLDKLELLKKSLMQKYFG